MKWMRPILPDPNEIVKGQGFAVFIMFLFLLGMGSILYSQYNHAEDRMDMLEDEIRKCYGENRAATLEVLQQNSEIMRENTRVMKEVKDILKNKINKQ